MCNIIKFPTLKVPTLTSCITEHRYDLVLLGGKECLRAVGMLGFMHTHAQSKPHTPLTAIKPLLNWVKKPTDTTSD